MPNETMIKPETLDQLNGKLAEMIAALSLDIRIDSAKAEHDTVYFNLRGKDSGYLLEHHAEPVKSMAFLLQTWHDHVHGENGTVIKLDADGELRTKDEELIAMAQEACEKLTEIGQEVRLEAMNPYDRRLVHMVVGDRPDYETESIGTGHFKSMILRRIK